MSKDSGIDYFLELVEKTGVAISSVSDGYVLMFKREHLKQLIEKYPDNEHLIIMVKQPQFKN